MAITQERFQSVITSGLAWKLAFRAITREIKQTLEMVNREEISARDALTTIATLSRANEPPVEMTTNLEVEDRYFQANARRNELARQRASRYRFNNGTAHRATAPDEPRAPNSIAATTTQKHSPERAMSATLDKATRDAIKREAEEVLAATEAHRANPDVQAANLAPPPDLSDLFK